MAAAGGFYPGDGIDLSPLGIRLRLSEFLLYMNAAGGIDAIMSRVDDIAQRLLPAPGGGPRLFNTNEFMIPTINIPARIRAAPLGGANTFGQVGALIAGGRDYVIKSQEYTQGYEDRRLDIIKEAVV